MPPPPPPTLQLSHRLHGALPKVGIRPAIDGRRQGVRESLEEQTMAMARSAAKLISAEVRHACGLPVECVIADSCIGGVAESAQAAEKFARAGVAVSLTVSPCWCYGSETMDMDPLLPKAVWGFNGTERPGAVYLAAVLAGHSQKGLPAFGIYGRDVQAAKDTEIPADVREKILRFVRAGLAVGEMRGKSYLSLGNVSMGIAGSLVDQSFFERYLNMRVETVDMIEMVRRIERKVYDEAEFTKALEWVKANCREGKDYNGAGSTFSAADKAKHWETSIKMTLIARDLMIGNPRLAQAWPEEAQGRNALAGGFQGQRHWTDHLPNGDFMEAILNSSFDWNGPRQPFVFATENDALNAVAMLFGHLLTGTAQIFADVRTYWSPAAVKKATGHELAGAASAGILHLINSGAAALDGAGRGIVNGQPALKRFWELTPAEIDASLQATSWHSAIAEYFRGGGFSSHFVTTGGEKGMPITMARLNLVAGLGPALQLVEGWAVDLPQEVSDILEQRTNPTWPTTWFAPRLTGQGAFRDAYSVMNAWGRDHGAFSYGHIGADLLTLAAMLRIPVYMHNVAEEDTFRPSAWHAFGTAGLEGADFRACANFGPLYGGRR